MQSAAPAHPTSAVENGPWWPLTGRCCPRRPASVDTACRKCSTSCASWSVTARLGRDAHDLPFRQAVCDQAPRWLRAGCFESFVHNLRAVLRLAAGRPKESLAVVLGSRALRSTPQVGTRATWTDKTDNARRGHSPRSKRTQVRTMRTAFTSSNSSRSGRGGVFPKPEASTGKTYGQLGCTRWKEISSARPPQCAR